MDKNNGENDKYIFKIDREKIKLHLKGIKEKFNKKNNKKKWVLLLLVLIIIGSGLSFYFYSMNQQDEFYVEQEPDFDIYKEERLEDDEKEEINEIEEQTLKQDVVTEPLKDVMEREEKEIKLLKPVSGNVLQDKGWYFHPVFKDWRYLTGANIEVKMGEIVMAADSGTVEEIKMDDYKGKLVKISHGDVWKTYYGHLQEVSVSEEEVIGKGQEIGKAGKTGITREPVLFFELRNKEGPVAPLDYIE